MSAWTEHLNKYRAAHPDKSMRQCMQEASKTYKKNPKSPRVRPHRG